MSRIASSFYILLISLGIIIVLFACFILCKPFCFIGCVYLGWVNLVGEPTFRYPLNYFELKLKMRRMVLQKICK
jgi:hypothetical protein